VQERIVRAVIYYATSTLFHWSSSNCRCAASRSSHEIAQTTSAALLRSGLVRASDRSLTRLIEAWSSVGSPATRTSHVDGWEGVIVGGVIMSLIFMEFLLAC
jgi:hypothetical protein